MKRLLICAAIVFATTTAQAGELMVSALQVKPKLKAGVPYTVTLPYEKTGEVNVRQGCFKWSGEGPYCFKPQKVTANKITVRLRTGNPNKYQLTGYIIYQANGQMMHSNEVSASIDVR